MSEEKSKKQLLRCSFCGKHQEQVTHRMIQGPAGVYICDECVRLCMEHSWRMAMRPSSERIRLHPTRSPPRTRSSAVLDQYVIGQDEAKVALSRGGVQPL